LGIQKSFAVMSFDLKVVVWVIISGGKAENVVDLGVAGSTPALGFV
jgi:hypothetical protein